MALSTPLRVRDGLTFSDRRIIKIFISDIKNLSLSLSLSLSVQHECIPQAILGMDVVCQAKSGMGKTAVFVISTLQQLDTTDGQVSVLVLCHAR